MSTAPLPRRAVAVSDESAKSNKSVAWSIGTLLMGWRGNVRSAVYNTTKYRGENASTLERYNTTVLRCLVLANRHSRLIPCGVPPDNQGSSPVIDEGAPPEILFTTVDGLQRDRSAYPSGFDKPDTAERLTLVQTLMQPLTLKGKQI